VLLKIT